MEMTKVQSDRKSWILIQVLELDLHSCPEWEFQGYK